MWVEELPNGKYKYFERYKDTYTEKWKRVSVTLNSGSNRAKKEAQRLLDDKIAEKMASFIEYFQNDLTEKGVDISQYGFYNRDTILYMSVPDDYKYYDRTDLQKFADGMLAKEHEAFMFGLRSTTSIMSAIRCFTLKRMMAVLLQVKNSMEK